MARRTKLGAALVAALACAGLAAAALAGVHKYDTRLTIARGGGGFVFDVWHGEVKSERGKCQRERRVVLFKQRPGADRKLGTARSAGAGPDEGSWSLDLHRENLAEVAQVDKGKYAKVRRESGNGYVCRADRAPNHGTV
jgi:hypothetical protein